MAKRTVHFATVAQHYPFLPYQWGILRAFVESDPSIAGGYSFEAPIFMYSHVAERISRMKAPFMFAVSCYVWNFRLHMDLCRRVKRQFKDCVIVAGGPHIPDAPGEFFLEHPYVDILVHGEGELPFRSILLEYLKGEADLDRIPNISYQRNRVTTSTQPVAAHLPREIADPELPSPYLLGYFDEMVDEVRDMHGRVWALWETNRGCPYACTFCEWGAVGFDPVKRFGLERLHREIDWFGSMGLEGVYSADANFGMFERDLDLAHRLVDVKKRTGSPRYFKTNFAKNSNERVFQAGRLFAGAGMSWGTIIGMQSTDPSVLKAIKRKNIGKDSLRLLHARHKAAGIPTYTDLIIPLPMETRESWFNGICDLFSCGQHENVRAHELALLPNTPMACPEERLKYNLQTVEKRIFGPWPRDQWGSQEIVYATSTMSLEDWVDCRSFHFLICQTLHNGGYTRFLSMYLDQQGLMTYRAFYVGMYESMKDNAGSFIGSMIQRICELVREYLFGDELQQPAITTQPDLVADLGQFARRGLAYWHVYEWPWIRINQSMELFYGEVRQFLEDHGIFTDDPTLADAFVFQRDIMLTPDYDPAVGKTCSYQTHWPRYFFGDGELLPEPTAVRFSDVAMGMDYEDELVAKSPSEFLQAACGNYWEGGTVRRYFHQPDRMWCSTEGLQERLPVQWGSTPANTALSDSQRRIPLKIEGQF